MSALLNQMYHAQIVPKVYQYGFMSFRDGDTKLETFLPKNQHTQRKLLNFENLANGEVSKFEHHFSNKII